MLFLFGVCGGQTWGWVVSSVWGYKEPESLLIIGILMILGLTSCDSSWLNGIVTFSMVLIDADVLRALLRWLFETSGVKPLVFFRNIVCLILSIGDGLFLSPKISYWLPASKTGSCSSILEQTIKMSFLILRQLTRDLSWSCMNVLK